METLISSSTLTATAVLVLASAVYLFVYRWCQRHRRGPKSWPLLGATLEALHNYERLHDWVTSYLKKADTIHVPMLFGFGYTYTANPGNVEYILKSNFRNFPKGKAFYENMEEVLGDGIFNTDGEIWRQQRKTASFEFSSRVLRDFSTVSFRDIAQKLAYILVQAARGKFPIDMQDLFMRMTLDSICKIGFGVDIGSLSPLLPEVPFAIAFDQANYVISLRFIDPLWKLKRLFNFGVEAILKESVKVMDDFTNRVIRTRRAEIEATRNHPKARPDILSRFISLSEDPESNLNDKSLRDVVLNFVIAGRDTTAVTLSWFIYMLTEHEDVSEKIYEELCRFEAQTRKKCNQEEVHERDHEAQDEHQIFQAKIAEFAQLLTYDSLTRLTYLHASISETLRLYPAVPMDPKSVCADDVLPDGTKLKKGCMVSYSAYGMGRMKSIWGTDADTFNPERWFRDGELQSFSPFRFTAFQAGPRICIGKDFAYLQMKMTAAILCRFFKFKLVQGHVVKYKMMPVLPMAHGLKVTVSPNLNKGQPI